MMRILDSVPFNAGKKGIQYQWYCHYTSIDKLQKMFSSKTMHLTRCSSLQFDDAIEVTKYGIRDASGRRYIGCFSIGKLEIAAMWSDGTRGGARRWRAATGER